VLEPFSQTSLMNKLNTTATLTWVEKWGIWLGRSSTHATDLQFIVIWLCCSILHNGFQKIREQPATTYHYYYTATTPASSIYVNHFSEPTEQFLFMHFNRDIMTAINIGMLFMHYAFGGCKEEERFKININTMIRPKQQDTSF
jgi:hypothetical protein